MYVEVTPKFSFSGATHYDLPKLAAKQPGGYRCGLGFHLDL